MTKIHYKFFFEKFEFCDVFRVKAFLTKPKVWLWKYVISRMKVVIKIEAIFGSNHEATYVWAC